MKGPFYIRSQLVTLALIMLGIVCLATTQAPANPMSGEQIAWQVLAGGGNRGTSTSYILSGSVGQTAVGSGTAGSNTLLQGYWQNFAGTPSYLCGDADGNSMVNISDAVYVISYIFSGGPAPSPMAAGDCDCNGFVNISDAVYLIGYIFGSGPAPCDPDNDGIPEC